MKSGQTSKISSLPQTKIEPTNRFTYHSLTISPNKNVFPKYFVTHHSTDYN